MSSRVMHVDMDAFFAAVEQAKNPHLRGRPVVVGGGPRGRGVVATASYEARVFGIHSAMPLARAARLCPSAVFVSGSSGQYAYLSAELTAIYREFSPRVEAVSVDEAFLDVSGCAHLFGGERELGQRLKGRVLSEFGLTCSVGIAPNKPLAKLASSVFKPDGLTVLHRQDLARVIYPLPVGTLGGIGPVARKHLVAAGLRSLGDLAEARPSVLRQVLGKNAAGVQQVVRGEPVSVVVPGDQQPDEQSIGHEVTLAEDTSDRWFLGATLNSLADRVARRMRRRGFQCRTITLKCRFADFATITRRTTLPKPTDISRDIGHHAGDLLLPALKPGMCVRLVGISASRLTRMSGRDVQGDLFHGPGGLQGGSRVDSVMDDIRNRFGEFAVRPALSLIGSSHRSD